MRHTLADVDLNAKTAVCAIDGPVSIKVWGTTKTRWRCMVAVKQDAKERPRVRTPDQRRAWKYGIQPAEYKALRKLQRGRCRICKKRKPLVVDHNHKTGKVRGLLCSSCNIGIGLLLDDPVILRSAASYVERR